MSGADGVDDALVDEREWSSLCILLSAVFAAIQSAFVDWTSSSALVTAPSSASSAPRYKSAHVRDVTVFHRSTVAVNVLHEKHWLITNNGDVQWPDDTTLKLIRGDAHVDVNQFHVGALAPAHVVTVRAQFKCVQTGRFNAVYRLQTANTLFGVKLHIDCFAV